MKNPKTSVSVSFEFGVDLAEFHVMIQCFSYTLRHSLSLLHFFYHHNDHLLDVLAVKPLFSK